MHQKTGVTRDHTGIGVGNMGRPAALCDAASVLHPDGNNAERWPVAIEVIETGVPVFGGAPTTIGHHEYGGG